MSQKVDPRASSGKFLRVKSRYPESFEFLCLCIEEENDDAGDDKVEDGEYDDKDNACS